MKPLKTLIGCAIIAYTLGACSSVTPQNPQELVRHSVKRQFTHDYAYQFKGKLYAELTDFDDHTPANDDEKNPFTPEQQAKFRKYAQRFGNGIFFPYSGAVDFSQSKLEIIPEMRMETRNSLSYAKFPLQLDWKNMKLYADAESITFWADPFLELLKIPPVDDQYLMVQMPKSEQNRIPLIQNMIKTLPEALDKGYTAVPNEAFKTLPMDEWGKKLGAAHRIGIDMSVTSYQKMMQAVLTSMREQLSKNPPPDGTTAEEYEKILTILEDVAKNNDEEKHDDAEKAKDAEWKQYALEHSEWYLDKNGRLLAQRSSLLLPEKVNHEWAKVLGKNKTVKFSNDFNIQYTKKPVFTIQPTAGNVYDVTCLLEDSHSCPFMQKYYQKEDEKKHDDSDDSGSLNDDDDSDYPAKKSSKIKVKKSSGKSASSLKRQHKK